MISTSALKLPQTEAKTVLIPPCGQSNLIQRARALTDLIELYNKSYVPLLKKCVSDSDGDTDLDPHSEELPELPDNGAIWNELENERMYLLDHLTYRVGALLKTLDDPKIDRLVDTEMFWWEENTDAEKVMDGLAESNPSFNKLYSAGRRLFHLYT